jgi:glycine cleavage system transcriptional repressor
MQELAISAIGPDHPGLVDQLSEALARFNCNIADSRMVNLHGQFAIVMRVQLPDSDAESLKQQLPRVVEPMGLSAMAAPAGDGGTQPGVPYRIRTYAMDQAGIVHRIAHALSERKVNIEDMTSRLEHGPHTGTPLFSMDMVVTIPTEVKLQDVRTELEALCAELNCDLDIDRA